MKITLMDKPTYDCFALIRAKETRCRCLSNKHKGCGTKLCPFYKPVGCSDWVRLEKGEDAYVIPPEEYYEVQSEEDRD